MFAMNTDDDKVADQAELAYKIEEAPLATCRARHNGYNSWTAANSSTG